MRQPRLENSLIDCFGIAVGPHGKTRALRQRYSVEEGDGFRGNHLRDGYDDVVPKTFGILDQEPGGILLDAVKVFLEAEVAVPHGDGMFNADVADMPFLGGEAGDIGFILLVADDETVIPAVGMEPFALLRSLKTGSSLRSDVRGETEMVLAAAVRSARARALERLMPLSFIWRRTLLSRSFCWSGMLR